MAVGRAVAVGATLALAGGVAQPVVAGASEKAAVTGGLAAATPKRGGILHVVSTNQIVSMAPTATGVGYENAGATLGGLYGYLGYLNPKTGAVILQFLKSIKGSNNEKTWTLTLHPNIKFSDGTPFNAAAIAYTLTKMADPKGGDQNYKMFQTWKWKVVNDLTLQITLPTPNAGFPALMTQDFAWIGSEAAWKKEGNNFDSKPVGAGPFKLQSYTLNSKYTYVRNPYYSSFAPGQPYLDGVDVDIVNAESQLMTALQTGNDQAAWLQGNTQFQQARTAGLNVQTILASGGEFLQFNTTHAPFNQLLARKAVSDALDHQQLASVWSAGSTPFNNLFAKTSPYYNPKYNFTGTNTKLAASEFKQLQAKGVKLSFSIVVPQEYPQIADYVQATLDKYPGVHVKSVVAQDPIYVKDGQSGNFGIFTFGMNFVNPLPTVFTYFGKGMPTNFGHWVDPAYDKAAEAVQLTTNPTVLKREYSIMAKEMATQYPIYAAQGSELAYATNKDVHNVQTIEYGATPLLGPVWMS